MNDQISFSSNRNSMQKFKVVLVGDQNVGKSSIIGRYIRNQFDPTKNPTIGIDFISKNIAVEGKMVRLQLWDTAGQERFKSLIPSYLKDAHLAIVVFDLTSNSLFTQILHQSRVQINGQILQDNQADLKYKYMLSGISLIFRSKFPMKVVSLLRKLQKNKRKSTRKFLLKVGQALMIFSKISCKVQLGMQIRKNKEMLPPKPRLRTQKQDQQMLKLQFNKRRPSLQTKISHNKHQKEEYAADKENVKIDCYLIMQIIFYHVYKFNADMQLVLDFSTLYYFIEMKSLNIVKYSYVNSVQIKRIKLQAQGKSWFQWVKAQLNVGQFIMSSGYKQSKLDIAHYYANFTKVLTGPQRRRLYLTKSNLWKLPPIGLLFCIPGGIPLILGYMAFLPALTPTWFLVDQYKVQIEKSKKQKQISALKYFIQCGSIKVNQNQTENKFSTAINLEVLKNMSLEQQRKVEELCYGQAFDGTNIIRKSFKLDFSYLISQSLSSFLIVKNVEEKLEGQQFADTNQAYDKLTSKILKQTKILYELIK